MYLLGVIAIMCSLKRDAISVLSMAFIIQIVVTPSAGHSISFILSYLALIGILCVGDAVSYIFKGKIPAVILGSLSVSVGAFLLTAGVCVYYFSVLRPIGIISSLILVPLITVFMVGSFIWLTLDIISPVLSELISPVLSLLYRLMEKTAVLSAYVPPLRAGFWPVLAVSLLLSFFIIWYAQQRRIYRNSFPAFN
jgi:competence protein ComEC